MSEDNEIQEGYIYITEKEIDGFDAYKLGFSETQIRGGLISVWSDYAAYKTLKDKFRQRYDRKGHYFIGSPDEMIKLVFATKFIKVPDILEDIKNIKVRKNKRKIIIGLVLLALVALVGAWLIDKFVD